MRRESRLRFEELSATHESGPEVRLFRLSSGTDFRLVTETFMIREALRASLEDCELGENDLAVMASEAHCQSVRGKFARLNGPDEGQHPLFIPWEDIEVRLGRQRPRLLRVNKGETIGDTGYAGFGRTCDVETRRSFSCIIVKGSTFPKLSLEGQEAIMRRVGIRVGSMLMEQNEQARPKETRFVVEAFSLPPDLREKIGPFAWRNISEGELVFVKSGNFLVFHGTLIISNSEGTEVIQLEANKDELEGIAFEAVSFGLALHSRVLAGKGGIRAAEVPRQMKDPLDQVHLSRFLLSHLVPRLRRAQLDYDQSKI